MSTMYTTNLFVYGLEKYCNTDNTAAIDSYKHVGLYM